MTVPHLVCITFYSKPCLDLRFINPRHLIETAVILSVQIRAFFCDLTMILLRFNEKDLVGPCPSRALCLETSHDKNLSIAASYFLWKDKIPGHRMATFDIEWPLLTC